MTIAKKIKKLVTIGLAFSMMFTLTACSSGENNKKETTTEKPTTAEATKETKTTTKQEETTTVKEVEKKEIVLGYKMYPECSTILENQELLNNVFNGRVIKKGETIDVKKEMNDLGIGEDHFGLFSLMYTAIFAVDDNEYFEKIEAYFSTATTLYTLDIENNIVFTNISDTDLKLDITINEEDMKFELYPVQ